MIARQILSLTLAGLLFNAFPLLAQSTIQGAPGNVGPSNIKRPPLKPPAQPLPEPTPIQPPSRPAPPVVAVPPSFTRPGLVAFRDGQWAGLDHLFNLSSSIPIVVDIVKSDALNLDLTKEDLVEQMKAAFSKERIKTSVEASDKAPLPFFNLMVMILPAQEGYAAYCGGRLFESVVLDRVNLEVGVFFQAITWESETMVFSSKEDFKREIQTAVDQITTEFLERYSFFQNLKR